MNISTISAGTFHTPPMWKQKHGRMRWRNRSTPGAFRKAEGQRRWEERERGSSDESIRGK